MTAIAIIVEGHGDAKAVPVLVRRLAQEFGIYDLVLPGPAIRISRAKALVETEIRRAVLLGAGRVKEHSGRGAVLVIVDADDDCAVELATQIRALCAGADVPLLVVAAVREYESVFLAAARSLVAKGYFQKPIAGVSPETVRGAKEQVSALMESYRETFHQERLTAVLDLAEARTCRWFRKLEQDLKGVLLG